MFQIRCRHSSVARGGGANGAINPPIGPKSRQNSMFLTVLRLIYALKAKIAPPKIVRWEVEVGVSAHENFSFFFEITWFWTETRSEFRWRPFFFFFFWRSLDFGHKNDLNFLNPIQDKWKFGSSSFTFEPNLKNPLWNPGYATVSRHTTCVFAEQSSGIKKFSSKFLLKLSLWMLGISTPNLQEENGYTAPSRCCHWWHDWAEWAKWWRSFASREKNAHA